MAIIRVIRGCGERHYVRSGTVVFCRWWKLFRRLQSGIRRKTRLTIHGECHSLANGGRHVVASDAQIRPHLSPLDTMELQQRTVVGLVLLESATTCAPRKRFLSAYFLENRPPPMHTHTHTHTHIRHPLTRFKQRLAFSRIRRFSIFLADRFSFKNLSRRLLFSSFLRSRFRERQRHDNTYLWETAGMRRSLAKDAVFTRHCASFSSLFSL